jgi:hypothetical protein
MQYNHVSILEAPFQLLLCLSHVTATSSHALHSSHLAARNFELRRPSGPQQDHSHKRLKNESEVFVIEEVIC